MRLKFRALLRYRPRILTLVVLLLVAAPTVLANFTSEWERQPRWPRLKKEYGWPLTWRWDNFVNTPISLDPLGSEFSAVRLATNLAIWLLVVASPAVACEWLLRRHRPRLRWSLRTMLVAVAAVAALCAWFARARERANMQDALIERMKARSENAWVRRSGPRWLDFLGLDRFRRRIVRANVWLGRTSTQETDLEVLDSLLCLPDLQFLDLNVFDLTPAVAERLRGMRSPNLQCLYLQAESLTSDITAGLRGLPQLRALSLHVYEASPRAAEQLADLQQLRALSIQDKGSGDSGRMSRQFLNAAAKLTALENLYLRDMAINRDSLQCLSGLANLKLLSLQAIFADGQVLLGRLPPLPRLESLNLQQSELSDDDVRHIVMQPRLKSLSLAFTDVTSGGVAQLASCKSLEELAIDDSAISIEALESLTALEHLRVLHIHADILGNAEEGDHDAQRRRRAFDSFRRFKPGIVIDDGTQLVTTPGMWEIWSDRGGGLAIGGKFELAR